VLVVAGAAVDHVIASISFTQVIAGATIQPT
jgi:hypothetical protein